MIKILLFGKTWVPIDIIIDLNETRLTQALVWIRFVIFVKWLNSFHIFIKLITSLKIGWLSFQNIGVHKWLRSDMRFLLSYVRLHCWKLLSMYKLPKTIFIILVCLENWNLQEMVKFVDTLNDIIQWFDIDNYHYNQYGWYL